MTLTAKQAEIVDLVRSTGAVYGVYQLAKLLGRPYRRVFDQVKRLSESGHLSAKLVQSGGRACLLITASPDSGHEMPWRRPPLSPFLAAKQDIVLTERGQPVLSYDRAWSSPITGVDDDTLIALVIEDPNFNDLLICCRHYGVSRVKRVFTNMLERNELTPLIQNVVGRILGNIEIGAARAARAN